jgi:uncharacterized membrane protein
MTSATERLLTNVFFVALLVLALWFRISGADGYQFWSAVILMLCVLVLGMLRSKPRGRSQTKNPV